jgi:hypothetical protein
MTHCLVNHHVTGHLVFVLVSTEQVMMCPMIGNPTSCKIHAVICFLDAKMSAVEIYCELCTAVYGQNVMSEGSVRQWCRMFRDGWANKCSWWRVKWSVICSEWWSCSEIACVLLFNMCLGFLSDFFPLSFSNQRFVCISHFLHHSLHHILHHLITLITGKWLQIMNLFLLFSTFFYYFMSLGPCLPEQILFIAVCFSTPWVPIFTFLCITKFLTWEWNFGTGMKLLVQTDRRCSL